MLALILLKFTWKLIWQLFLHLIAKTASSFDKWNEDLTEKLTK